MAFTCAKCGVEMATEGGLKRHHTRVHGPYSADDLRASGIETTGKDIARSIDGNQTIEDVILKSPDTESSAKDKTQNKREAKERAEEIAEFRRLRPQLVDRWKRRLRIPYSLWATLAHDPQIALTEKECQDGAELHVDFCEAMGWLKAGKIEAIIDLGLWHSATALSRSDLGKALIASFQTKPPEEKPN